MNASAVNRLLAYKRRLMILELLDNNKLTSLEVSLYISDSYSVIKSDLKRLYLSRYLSRERKFNSSCRKYVFAYYTKNKHLPMPNVIANAKQKQIVADVDFISAPQRTILPVKKLPHKKVIVDPVNPHITTYLNLNRDGADYAWQRKKHKTTISIGSTFSLYDGATL